VPLEILYPGMRVGLLGGSFNPAHAGHRHISLIALKRLRLDRVWWLVSPQNPLKPVKGMAGLDARVVSARKAARHPDIVVSTIEQRLRTTYTIDTLLAMRRRWPEVRFVWLMGADNLQQMPRWRAWNRIMRLVPVAVLDRPGNGIRVLQGKVAQRYRAVRLLQHMAPQLATRPAPAWMFLSCRLHPASSTAIRAGKK
jgi:nicotinate-nucleotide adenylyltransferase